MGDFDEIEGHDPTAEEEAVKPVSKKKEADTDTADAKSTKKP